MQQILTSDKRTPEPREQEKPAEKNDSQIKPWSKLQFLLQEALFVLA